ncbi:hypothetical protein Hamer_G007969, partial [Homarus americanus]
MSNKLGPHVNAKACFYHLTQSTWRKIQSLGLSNRYKEDGDIKHFCGMLDGLAFLPVDRIQDLVDYFDANHDTVTYRRIGQTRQYPGPVTMRVRRIPLLLPPEKWNVNLATIENEYRTNNLCESWNRGFQQLVGYSHPTIWTAIERIRKDAAIVSMHLTLDARGQPPYKRVRRETRDLQKRLKSLY